MQIVCSTRRRPLCPSRPTDEKTVYRSDVTDGERNLAFWNWVSNFQRASE